MTDSPAHRVHVLPWLRVLERLLIRDWLAITIGRHIFAWRALGERELAHELEHVRQWRRYGPFFPLVYLLDSARVRRGGKRWYDDNRFEVAAREAANRL